MSGPRGIVVSVDTAEKIEHGGAAQSSYLAGTMSWLDQADLESRKSLGQYMTPRGIREALVDHLDLFPGMKVLDPGAGTGEFLASVSARESEADLTGWDVDAEILSFAARNVPHASFEKRSALDPTEDLRFDLVVGNPPYFQFRATPEQKRWFSPVISGRPNIFALFFQVAFEVARPGGQIAFVVPPSMNNGAYFESLREFIVSNGEIEHLEILEGNDLFEDANTAAQLIVIRVGANGDRFHWRRRCEASGFRRVIFSSEPKEIEAEFRGRPTLHELGFEAVTGTVVWNQNRDKLAREPSEESVPLIWAHNIENGRIKLKEDHKRPQYVVGKKPLRGPALVVNRIVGAVGKGSLRSALVPEGLTFVGENHVNVIRPRRGVNPKISWEDLLETMSADEIGERVRRLTGNTQISAKELTHLMPLDVDQSLRVDEENERLIDQALDEFAEKDIDARRLDSKRDIFPMENEVEEGHRLTPQLALDV